MIFDDHDVHDDWNTSAAWRAEFEAKPWWRARITGTYQSYWIYQHLGNLSPAELAADETWRQVRQAGDAAAVLAGFARRADSRAAGIRFSVRRDFGNVRVVVIDSRSRRVIDDNSKRLMVDQAEWEWEAWNEAVCAGAWGKLPARTGERVRQALDLEHWASFGQSFVNFERLLSGLGAGSSGTPPASVTVISGDVHNSYLAPASLPGAASRSAIRQVVCSPVHNVLPPRFRRGYQFAESAAGAQAGHPVARQPRSVVRQHARDARIRRAPGARPLRSRDAGTPAAAGSWNRSAKRTSPAPEFQPAFQLTLGQKTHARPENNAAHHLANDRKKITMWARSAQHGFAPD